MKRTILSLLNILLLVAIVICVSLWIGIQISLAGDIGNERALPFHVAQSDITEDRISLQDIIAYGRYLFDARFTILDGAGRPGATGSDLPTRRPLEGARSFLRTSGPDANSCASCHHIPESGGAGDFVTSVFVGAHNREPVLMSVSPAFSAERGTPEMHGSGLIELLAREMTAEMHHIRAEAKALAIDSNKLIRKRLVTKGVDFGYIVAKPNGEVETSGVEGVDKDLVVRPWSQKGVVTSLRTFTVNALNQHHGMQAIERFGVRRTGSQDFDRDGVVDEVTEGDITALTLFQASLAPPLQDIPKDKNRVSAIQKGEKIFDKIGCVACHRTLELESSIYTEPGPYNLEGTLRNSEVSRAFSLDLASLPWGKYLKRNASGNILVQAFTDLKRHQIADSEELFFDNEVVSQGFAPTDEFISRRLWAVGNTSPYGHRGDVTTIDEVIRYHSGEARESRAAYLQVSPEDRLSIIEFLKSWRIRSDLGVSIANQEQISNMKEIWNIHGSNKAIQQQLISRVKAATKRAEYSAKRAEVFSTRVDYEKSKAGVESFKKSMIDEAPGSLVKILSNQREELQFDNDLILLVERAETAVRRAQSAAAEAVGNARFANPGSENIPTGRLDTSSMINSLKNAVLSNDQNEIFNILFKWCEDLAFRAEQFAQQAELAATRAEAEATHRYLAQ
jgi:hypothetical protein